MPLPPIMPGATAVPLPPIMPPGPGAGCCVALIEHRWMSQLRDDLRKQGIVVLGTGLIRPRSLVMLGATLRAAEEAYTQMQG